MSLGVKYISVEEVIADACAINGDEEGDLGSGYYRGQARDALIELAYDTHFDKRHFTAAVPTSLKLKLPEDLVRIEHVYLYNGSVCDFSSAINVYTHRHMTRSGPGGYQADNRGDNAPDPIQESSMSPGGDPNLKFYGEQNGYMALSSSCLTHSSIYVSYAGIGTDFCKEPIIPRELKQAVVDYIAYHSLQRRIAQSIGKGTMNEWMAVYNTIGLRLNGRRNAPFDGSWHRAKVLVARISEKLRLDMSKYLSATTGAWHR
jgi:hypothetical protein